MVQKKKFLLILGMMFASIMLFLTGCTKDTPEKNSYTIKIGILRVPNDVSVARQLGNLQKELEKKNIKVEFITFDSGVDANKALLSNDIQMATMGHTNAVVAMSADIPVNLVWVNDIIGSNEQLVFQKNIKLNDWSDYKGKRIATPFASTSHYSLMMFLKEHHLTNDVELLDMKTTEIVAAWLQGNIDGAYTWEPSLSNLKDAQTITDSSQLAKENILTANVTLATKKFQKDHPKELEMILSELEKQHQLLKKQPNQVYELTAKQLELTPQVTKKQIGTSQWLTKTDQKKFMESKFVYQFYKSAQFMWSQQTLRHEASKKQCQEFITTKFIK